MKAWMDYMTPSDVHIMLAKSDGEWNEEINMWMAPGAPVQSMQAACVNKMILEAVTNHQQLPEVLSVCHLKASAP